MRFTSTLLPLVSCGALGAAAFAQDSVSKLHALPGDAVDGRATNEQVNDYVVDQTIVRGSWGTVFGVAPLVKASLERNTAQQYFTGLFGAQYLSQDLKTNVPFLRSSYSAWSGQGFGVNDLAARNDPGTPTPTTGMIGYQFAAVSSDFVSANTTAGTANLANVVGTVVNFTNAKPSRLYVSRVVAASNATTETCGLAAFGLGSIDADGNAHFRVDGNGGSPIATCPTALPATGNNNWGYRVNLAARNGAAQNVIDAAGASDVPATTTLFSNVATTSCPNGIPNSVAGRPVYLAPNFAKQYVYENTAGSVTNTLGHYAAGVVDHRGMIGFRSGNVAYLGSGSVGVCGVLGKATLGGSDGAPFINLWGVDANGNVTGSKALQLPPTLAVPGVITDPDQPTWDTTVVPGPSEFDHYHSQVAYQGGSSQVAIGQDQQGNLIVAATVYYGLTYGTPPALSAHTQAPNNYIAVARIDPTGTNVTWSVAGWTQETTTPVFSDGKAIYQNGTTVIGRLTGASFAPPMSAPMIDSVGNVWFLSSVLINGTTPTTTTGLLRGVYDASTFSYKLELVTKVGDVLAGRNSATNYLIRFLDVADSNSVSSGTAFSGNIAPYAFQGQSTTGLATTDSRTLGGLVVHAGIIYDVDNDGLFVRSTGTGGVPTSPDEDYDVLLYLSSSSDVNNNDIPDDAEVAGTPFCAGDNLDPNVTTPCPCSNFGTAGNGCANSVNAAGANLAISGQSNPDTAVLSGSGMPATVSCIYLQGDALTDVAFGDGVRCAGGTLLRLRTKANVGGASAFPDSADTVSLSVRGGVVPGSGTTRYYQTYYRNSAALFCPPQTFNVTNGIVITW
ncbi:MAG: hypothetical protein U1F29_08835 [Planctomycetota bacterium]